MIYMLKKSEGGQGVGCAAEAAMTIEEEWENMTAIEVG